MAKWWWICMNLCNLIHKFSHNRGLGVGVDFFYCYFQKKTYAFVRIKSYKFTQNHQLVKYLCFFFMRSGWPQCVWSQNFRNQFFNLAFGVNYLRCNINTLKCLNLRTFLSLVWCWASISCPKFRVWVWNKINSHFIDKGIFSSLWKMKKTIWHLQLWIHRMPNNYISFPYFIIPT